jgi:hypothetical protein
MMMLLQIVSIMFLPVVIGTMCDRNFAKLGCYGRSPDIVTELLITDLDPTHHKWGEDIDWSDFKGSLHSLACRCRDKAIGKYQYFSLGFYGECFGASNAEVFESRKESQACINGAHNECTKDTKEECAGVQDAEYVYEILTAPPVPVEPTKSTKEEEKYKNVMKFPEEKSLTKNVLLTTIPKLSRSFIVKIQLKPSVFQSGWTNVFHMSAHGGNSEKYGDRIPGIWFWSSNPTAAVNRLHICSAVNGNRNYCYNSPINVPRGKWTEVEVTQREEQVGLYRYEVQVNNVVIGSVLNKGAEEFENVKVFTSDPWHENMKGQIRQLSIVPNAETGVSGTLTFPSQHLINKNALLTTIPVLTTSYIVKFQVNPSKFQWGWSNVIHLTSTGGNCCNYGDRVPAVWFFSASPTNTLNKLHISSAVNNNGNYYINTPKSVKVGVWTDVEISQRSEGSSYRYTVKVGGV